MSLTLYQELALLQKEEQFQGTETALAGVQFMIHLKEAMYFSIQTLSGVIRQSCSTQ